MNQRFIVIDGKTYKSVDEMPEEIRRKYEEAMRNLDKNGNGTPDILENQNFFTDKNNDGIPDALENLAALKGAHVMGSTKIMVNGQAYDVLDQLPPEIRAKYEQAMSAMDANRNGMPDFMEGMINVPAPATNNAPVSFGTPNPPLSKPIPASSTIEPESSGGWMLALAGIALVALCLIAAGAGVWYFFLR